MKATLVGISKQEGKSKATGKPYSGYFLYYCSSGDERVIGMKAADTFADDATVQPLLDAVKGDPNLLVNQKVFLDFNERGRLQEIALMGK